MHHGVEPIRIFHGPNNTGGIGYRLSRFQRQRGMHSDFWTLREHPRKKDFDICLTLDKKTTLEALKARLYMFLYCLLNYKIFHFYAGHSLLPLNLDLPILRLFRKRLVMTYCGSDIRLLKVEKERHGFVDLLRKAGFTERRDKTNLRKMFWHRLWVHKVTAPRNLFRYAREVYPSKMISTIWINNIDIFPDQKKARIEHPARNKTPLIVHAPTSQLKKGTEIIETALAELKNKGVVFDYQRIENKTHSEAIEIMAKSDIVVDQIIVGGIGNVGLEALAMGKTLCIYLVEEIVEELQGDLPLLNINMQNIEELIHRAVTDHSLRERFAFEGPAFLKKHINIPYILDEIEKLYGFSFNKS